MIMVHFEGQPHFFVRVAVGLAIDKAVYLAIGGAKLIEADIAVGFSGLSLW